MPVERPKIAVLLAAYNGIQWIEEQLNSIQDQQGVDVAVYISVDPSTDNTERWCAEYAERFDNVTILPTIGMFGGASRNFFRLIRDVDFKEYDFVAFADQDDVWCPQKLVIAVSTMNDKKADAYSSNVTAFWPDGRTCVLDKAQSQVKWDFLFEAAGPGCTYVLSKYFSEQLKLSIIEQWSRIQTVSLHDWYCYAFARSRGFRWFIDSTPSLLYRQHDRNQMGANKGIVSLVYRFKTITSGWWFGQIKLITTLVGVDKHPFVLTWLALRPLQLMRLSLSAGQCRRRFRDKFLFFFICWIAALSGGASVNDDE
ncbi:MAG: glycosyltransferase [Pseudomonas atacamensis]|jgi:rhamnosyltransferase|uniref:glycosyltransferase n=1 Tax=Pseudomonas atacamensis TaxID=2565368 RepID=UPI003315C31F